MKFTLATYTYITPLNISKVVTGLENIIDQDYANIIYPRYSKKRYRGTLSASGFSVVKTPGLDYVYNGNIANITNGRTARIVGVFSPESNGTRITVRVHFSMYTIVTLILSTLLLFGIAYLLFTQVKDYFFSISAVISVITFFTIAFSRALRETIVFTTYITSVLQGREVTTDIKM